MPFRTGGGGGFTGDGNMATFIDEVVETFLIDPKGSGGLGWISQNPDLTSPVRGKGTTPNFEFMFSRGSVGSEEPPYWNMQTASRTLFIYSGNGVDRTQESFDQPGNPVNEPPSDPVADIASGSIAQLRCLGITSAPGSYDDYWVFGGPTGEYCHVVLKVGPRQYRHFHCGMLTPLNSDLHADSFYVTNHRWGYLAPDNLPFGNTANAQSKEHQPYATHITPFGNNNLQNISPGNDCRSRGMWVYSPGYGSEGYDWWMMSGVPESADSHSGGGGASVYGQWDNFNQPTNVGSVQLPFKSIGDVVSNLESPAIPLTLFGAGFVSGLADSLGGIPFSCEPTFTTDGVSMVPIYVGLHSDFDSSLRWSPVGVIPDVFRINMKSLDAEQEIPVGSDTYVVFPLINKDANNTVANEGYSGYEGLAYKKITANAT